MKKRTVRCVVVAAVSAALAMPLLAGVNASKPLAGDAVAAAGDDPPVYRAPAPPASAPASAPSLDPATVVVQVGDEKITAGEFNQLVLDLPPQVQTQITAQPDGRKRLADELVNMKLLSDEARRRKLDQSPKTRLLYQQVLAQALMQSLSGDSGADEKFYNENKGYFDEIKARHILIATGDSVVPSARKLSDAEAKAKATAIKQRLDKGEDFATVAKTESDDTGSGADGGDLGVVTRGKMVGPFEAAAFGLKKGEISDPVRTQFGYHIIQTTDKNTPSFEQAKRRVSQRRFELMIDDLKKQEQPVYNDAYFGGKSSAPTTGPSSAPANQAPK